MDTNLVNEAAIIAIKILATALALLVTLYGPRLIRALEKRIGADLPDPLEAEAERLALRGIDYAEEWARGKAKALSGKVPSNEKLDQAAAWFREHARPAVVKWLDGKVEDWIGSVLGKARSNGPTPDWVKDDPA